MNDQPRVGFDALFLDQPITGTGRYATNLWRRLSQRMPQERLTLLAPANSEAAIEAGVGGSVVRGPMPPIGRRPGKVWWEQVGLPLATRKAGVDLVHVPHFAAPLLKPVPFVVTVHDVIPLVMPDYSGSRSMRAYLRLVSQAVASATLVLTDSEFSRRDIERRLGIPAERIRPIPLAAGPGFRPVRSDEDRVALVAARERYGLQRPFILNTGGLDLRKRLPALVDGYARALPHLPETHDLVIVGRAHTGNLALYPSLDRLIRRLGIEEHVRLVGAVPDEDFVNLYRGCALFVFASGYEGFGLTPLEAMSCGAPVVCSNRSSLPEVVGDAGYLIVPEPRQIANAIATVLGDERLREDLAYRSLERARQFTWDCTAERTLEAYDDAWRGSRGR